MNISNAERGSTVREIMMYAITKYIKEHQYAPTVREIGEMVGLKSTSTVQSHLNKLIADGKLETDAKPGSPRAIRIPGYVYVKSVDTESIIKK